jgi:hypothetical protein
VSRGRSEVIRSCLVWYRVHGRTAIPARLKGQSAADERSTVPLDEVFEILGRIREQVHSRLWHLCEDDGAYLNVAHVRYQIEQFDTVLKVSDPARNEPLGFV